MKKRKVLQVIALVLCVLLILPSCSLRRKGETTEDDDETEEESTPESSEDDAAVGPSLNVERLDQFISDGSMFAENVTVPTPTPIPVIQNPLGLTNEGKGYYEGPLDNATIVDNEYFRFTIVSTEVNPDTYIVNSEFENKTDEAFSVNFFQPVFDNLSSDIIYYTQVIEPHTVLEDTTDFTQCIENYNGVEPNRLSFLLIAKGTDTQYPTIAVLDDGVGYNYVPINIFPNGESAFVYQDRPLIDDSTILYDSDGALFSIDSFTTDAVYFHINYTFVNKTSEYVQLRLDSSTISLDNITYQCGAQDVYIAPYTSFSSDFTINISSIEEAGVDPLEVKTVAIPLKVTSLMNGMYILWQNTVQAKVVFG